MAALTITTCRIVDWVDKYDAPADEVINYVAGAVRFNGTTGQVTPANATVAGEAGFQGIAINAAKRVNQAVTVVRDGLLDVGNALDALNVGANVFLSNTDGRLDDAAGTVSVVVGTVVPGWGGQTSDKLLRVRKGGA